MLLESLLLLSAVLRVHARQFPFGHCLALLVLKTIIQFWRESKTER